MHPTKCMSRSEGDMQLWRGWASYCQTYICSRAVHKCVCCECCQATSTGFDTAVQMTSNKHRLQYSCADDKEGDMLTSASMVSKHPQDGAGPLGAYIAACSMPRYLQICWYAFWNSPITMSPVFHKVSNNGWPCSKPCWCKSLECLHSLPLWELAVSMQEKQAVPL